LKSDDEIWKGATNPIKKIVIYFFSQIWVRPFYYCALILFRIEATYEMRTTEHGEICISNDDQTIGEEGFYLKQKGEEREQTDGETERECVCVCLRWSTPMIASASIHKHHGIEKHTWL
jgi:hypothetical protein